MAQLKVPVFLVLNDALEKSALSRKTLFLFLFLGAAFVFLLKFFVGIYGVLFDYMALFLYVLSIRLFRFQVIEGKRLVDAMKETFFSLNDQQNILFSLALLSLLSSMIHFIDSKTSSVILSLFLYIVYFIFVFLIIYHLYWIYKHHQSYWNSLGRNVKLIFSNIGYVLKFYVLIFFLISSVIFTLGFASYHVIPMLFFIPYIYCNDSLS